MVDLSYITTAGWKYNKMIKQKINYSEMQVAIKEYFNMHMRTISTHKLWHSSTILIKCHWQDSDP